MNELWSVIYFLLGLFFLIVFLIYLYSLYKRVKDMPNSETEPRIEPRMEPGQEKETKK